MDSKHRAAVTLMLRNRKGKSDLDNPVTSEDELWGDIAKDFNGMSI